LTSKFFQLFVNFLQALLPIMGSMYLDILEAKQETKRQQEVMQRMINHAKEKKESN